MTKLWYDTPAANWNEALPLGNGSMGAKCFGGTTFDRFSLNDDTVWSGGLMDRINPDALAAIPEVSRLLREGRISEAEENACRELLKITYDNSCFRLEKIAKLPDEGAVWIKLCVDHADGRFYYSLDGEHFEPAGDAFDASKLSDEYNRPLAFTGPYVGIGCQDLSNWQKTADFRYFRYTEKQ